MEDSQIIDLYYARNEDAIVQTDAKYGPYCRTIAKNVLSFYEDTEECVNDTWLAAWNRMPPDLPRCLRAFLGRITRNLAISRVRANRAQKRYNGMEVLLSELAECIPAARTLEEEIDSRRLGEVLSQWLDTLDREDRILFVRRYWYGERVMDLAAEQGVWPEKLTQKLLRLRKKLRKALEQEGVDL